jgi:hypothetical protein
METRMSILIAQERMADLERKAEAKRRASEVVEEHTETPVLALRLAGPDEADELAELAELDSQRPLTGDVLVALLDGELVAAMSLEDGRVVADPLVRTLEERALLRTRAAQLKRGPKPRRRRFRLRFA